MSNSFYDDASLVVIPSGYKTSKVYAEKPTDGSGDLTFTRTGDTATRVNSAGLIERVRTNLALQSQTFDNASWYKEVGNSATANTIANPLNGAVDADTITATATNAMNVNQLFTAAVASEYTYSIYLKKNNHDLIQPYIFSVAAGGFVARIEINLSDGTFTTINGSGATVTSVGSGWYRVTLIAPFSTTNVFTTGFLTSSTTGSRSVYVFGAQLETGVATPYIATTTAAVSVGPVANVPRLDYLNSSCPRLLLEPQRSNLITFSEQLDNAAWGGAGTTITANQAVSPDGYTNADLAVNAASSNYIFQGIVGSISGTFTASIFAKKGTQSSFAFGMVSAGFGNGMGVKFNFDTQTFSTPTNYANFTSISASYQSYGNGWYRLNLTGTTAISTAYFFVLGSLLESFAVNAYVWGAQLEAGAYATSYIPTLAASATRGADACSKTGISSLIGQTEGVAFIDFVWNGLTGVGSYPRIIELATDANNIIQLYSIAGTTSWGWDIFNGGVVQFTGSSTMALGRNKIAIGYKLNDMVVYKNGTLVASDTSCTVPATSALGVTGIFNGAGGAQLAASVNQTLLFKTRLTNAELAELTTL